MLPNGTLAKNTIIDNSMRYREHIDGQQSTLDLIPLMHTCDGIGFRGIIDSKQIATTHCSVFNENLAYYFYGRPAYRLKREDCTGMIQLFPVCFIIEPAGISSFKRAYPFDTGAFDAALYQQHVVSKLEMSQFEFKPNFDFIKKFVEYIYTTNGNYYKGKATLISDDLPPLAAELQSIVHIINNKGLTQVDDRCTTIEVQSDNPLDITNGSVKAIIMPSEMLGDESVTQLLIDYNIDPITYEVYRSSPSSTTSVILNKASEYLSDTGVI
ncbi:conserved hypothetical protein [Vibrio crassostreae]|nr:conserved hypothetical protein [Vibrio crassostreae]CAK2326163.1 conserved hypothetical protein [Vibrio crassostreae]CAK2480254.1 conserved hypothetical protein [Vibrio crassostreae]CAK2882691.1 conserved hypothetical protein [Vibrio crassostreae]